MIVKQILLASTSAENMNANVRVQRGTYKKSLKYS